MGTRACAIVIAFALALLALACARPTRTARAPAPGRPHLVVMTYNVNFGTGGDAETIALIRAGAADVVFLQETTAAWEASLRRELADLYPHMQFRHCCRAGGLGVLSRYPFEARDYLPAPAGGWFPAWRLVVDSPLGKLQVLNVHLHPPLSESGSVVSGYFSTPSIRRDEIAEHVTRLDAGLPTLVVGDFNEDAGGRAIAYLARHGLKTALPAFAPGADTWRWTTSVGTVHSQLDHVVHDARLEPIDARVLQGGNSDHLPVVVTLEAAR